MSIEREYPKLREYELLLQLGHTADYQEYAAKDPRHPDRFLTIRQARPLLEPHEIESALDTLSQLGEHPHPHLPSILDQGVEDDTLFWVSEYVEGESLLTLRKAHGPMPADVTAAVLLDVASALRGVSRVVRPAPVLPEDIQLGIDGYARYILPLRDAEPRRKAIDELCEQFAGTAREVVYLVALAWQCLTDTTLKESLHASPPRKLAAEAPDAPRELSRVFADALSSAPTQVSSSVQGFAVELGRVTSNWRATHAQVSEWMRSRLRERLQLRSHLLHSRIPEKPSGEIPLVEFPSDLRAIHLPSDEPRAPDPSATPRPSTAPEEDGSTSTDKQRGRAPLESALAEYAERAHRRSEDP